MSSNRFCTLNTGATIPSFGFGTWRAEPGQVKASLVKALEVGYRHIDLAKIYGNQKEIGESFKEAFSQIPNLKRSDVFITSKLWNSQHHPKRVAAALDDTLQELGLEYLDLYLIHFPVSFKTDSPNTDLVHKAVGKTPLETVIDDNITIVDTWKAMTQLDKTKARAVGVSNFTIQHLETIIKATGITPAALQIERHPRLPDVDLVKFCQSHHIHITAYSPLGNNTIGQPLLTEHAKVKAIAQKIGSTPAQVLLAWSTALDGISVVPKSVTPKRIEENFDQKTLASEEMEILNGLGRTEPCRYNIPWIANDPRWPINIFNTPEESDLPHQVILGHV